MRSSWVAERAAEELRVLEAEHPGRFGLLKLELRTLILDSGCCFRCSPYAPSTGPSWVVERAVEELRVLEAEHPDRHGCLKLELRAFISDSLRFSPLLPPPCACLPPTSSAATQGMGCQNASSVFERGRGLIWVRFTESSNRKRRREAKDRRVRAAEATGQQKLREETRPKATRDSVDMALERAQQCLRKIQRVKEMLAHGC